MLNLCKYFRQKNRFRKSTNRKRLRVENFSKYSDFLPENRY